MTMDEIVDQVSFMLGLPANDNVEGLDIRNAVNIAFRELKRYIRTPVEKTVPYSTRINLEKVGIDATAIMSVMPAHPRIGLTMGSIDSGNVFQVAASVNVTGAIGQTSTINIDPILTEMAMAQVRNTLSTDLQWRHDTHNNVLYVTHRDPKPAAVTIRYTPNYKDVSEITSQTWVDYLVRMSEANMKKALGRSRSKYTVEGSNVQLDGEALLAEANAELEAIRQELKETRRKLVVVN